MTGPYLSAKHAAEYLDMKYAAFDQFVRRHGVPHVRVGRSRRFTKEQLDRVVRTMALRKAG